MARRVLVAAVAVLLVSLPRVATAGTTTMVFDDLPNPNRVLNGQYPAGVVDWGTNAWYLSGRYGLLTTNSVSFNGATPMSGSLIFVNPQRLVQLDAFNGGSGTSTITLDCPGQTPIVQAVSANQLVTINPGWLTTCTPVTIGSSNGWWTNFDNLVIDTGVGPVLSAIQATGVTRTGATISWTTNVGASSQVDYGPTTAYGASSVLDPTLLISHSVMLSNLSEGTLYHYRARSMDAAGTRWLGGDATFMTMSSSCTTPIVNRVACENTLAGAPSSQWDIPTHDMGDSTLQGFTNDISYAPGETVDFKISTPANAYSITIYRVGFYQGNGARLLATVTPSATLPQAQPACLRTAATGLTDCGNWSVSASWLIPTNAVSGAYFARLQRPDTGGVSHILFVVRDDARHAPLLFQTSDTTWQAYNNYGGSSLYFGGPGTNPNRAYKVRTTGRS